MNRTRTTLLAGLAGVLALAGCDQTAPDVAPADESPLAGLALGDAIPGRYVVVLKKDQLGGETSRAALQRVAEEMGADGEALVFTNTITGFAAELSAKDADALASDDRIEFIEPDRVFGIEPLAKGGKGKGGGGNQPAQTSPYGIARVNGGVASTGRACILDTGIDLDHPDLNVDRNASRTFITSGRDSRSADDRNGHGTHVAGTVAAIDNSIGVIGVAAGATVVAVKVLDGSGSGSTSGVIAGVDYVGSGQPGCDVANMSLGGGASSAMDAAVIAAAANGVKFALAAGNSARDANTSSPARANGPNIYTISAIDSQDRFASFSNFGNPPVDYAAPGVSVYSTYPSGGYATLSGTSMAAPHAAGVLLLGAPKSGGNAVNDPDGNADPIMVH